MRAVGAPGNGRRWRSTHVLLEALAADDFRQVRAATEALEPALLLELRDLRAT
jgi:hypothetical protein